MKDEARPDPLLQSLAMMEKLMVDAKQYRMAQVALDAAHRIQALEKRVAELEPVEDAPPADVNDKPDGLGR